MQLNLLNAQFLFLQSGLNDAGLECSGRFDAFLAQTYQLSLPNQDVKLSPCAIMGI